MRAAGGWVRTTNTLSPGVDEKASADAAPLPDVYIPWLRHSYGSLLYGGSLAYGLV